MSGVPPIRYVVFHKPGPEWRPGVDFKEQAGVSEHVMHYKKLQEEGRLSFGGPFLDDSGGMMIPVEGETMGSIEEFASSDPAVKSGLLTYKVKPWLLAMSK